jgi:hypothetical protein
MGRAACARQHFALKYSACALNTHEDEKTGLPCRLHSCRLLCLDELQPPEQPEIITLEQQVQAIAQSGHTTAEQLSALAEKDAALVAKILRGRYLSVSGILQKALVRGVAADELSLDLTGTARKKVCFSSNHRRLAKKEVPSGGSDSQGMAHAIMGKLASLGQGGGGGSAGRSSSGASRPSLEKNLIYREGAPATIEGTFQYINRSSVMLDWHPPGG